MRKKLSEEQKELNRKAREEKKELARIEAEKAQPEIKEMTITIEWKKSRMWGHNPHAKAEITFKDDRAGPWNSGFYRTDTYTCSGCGYDKESTVIAKIFNDYLKYKLWNMTDEQIKGGNGSGDIGKAPYGVRSYTFNSRHYGGGIGADCYYAISEFIGGKFQHIASGETFDVFKYTDDIKEDK